jgi:hypothetical protein
MSQVKDELFAEAMQEIQRPSVTMRPMIWCNGHNWSCAYMNPDGIISGELCGEGDTPRAAMLEFDKKVNNG